MSIHAQGCGAACAVLAGALLWAQMAAAAPQVGTPAPGQQGKVIINDRGKARIHTFAPAPMAATSQIVETADGLVVIDAQQFVSGTRELLAYLKTLGKPVRRLIVSHGHPDHWLGLGEWGDQPAAALAEVRDFINGEEGSFIYRARRDGVPPYPALGAELSARKGVITNLIPEGREKLIGLDFVFEKIIDAEADVQMLVRLPELNTLVMQDMIYNNQHHFIGQNRLAKDALPTFDAWADNLRRIKRDNPGTELVLAGHGEPTGPAVLDESIAYLGKARQIFQAAKGADDLHGAMEAAFPGLAGIRYIDISSRYMYPPK
jgi:glyoxylase-like metal-dependent hydrolase (beta-lactamase superfamily II)